MQSFCLQKTSVGVKVIHLFDQIILNFDYSILKNVGGSHKHVGWENGQPIEFFQRLVLYRIKRFYFFYFISEKMNFKSYISITGEHIDDVSIDSEISTVKNTRCARVEALNQFVEELCSRNAFPTFYFYYIFLKL